MLLAVCHPPTRSPGASRGRRDFPLSAREVAEDTWQQALPGRLCGPQPHRWSLSAGSQGRPGSWSVGKAKARRGGDSLVPRTQGPQSREAGKPGCLLPSQTHPRYIQRKCSLPGCVVVTVCSEPRRWAAPVLGVADWLWSSWEAQPEGRARGWVWSHVISAVLGAVVGAARGLPLGCQTPQPCPCPSSLSCLSG